MMKLTGLNLLSNLIYDPYITNACAQMDLRHPNTHLLKLKTKVRDKLIYPSTSSTSNWHFMIHWPACFAAGKNLENQKQIRLRKVALYFSTSDMTELWLPGTRTSFLTHYDSTPESSWKTLAIAKCDAFSSSASLASSAFTPPPSRS